MFNRKRINSLEARLAKAEASIAAVGNVVTWLERKVERLEGQVKQLKSEDVLVIEMKGDNQ